MNEKQTNEARHPVCAKHWQEMRKETISGLPLWTKPFAAVTASKALRARGFYESKTECTFCRTGTSVEKVK